MNLESVRQKTYDCTYCQEKELYGRRTCFWYGGEVNSIEVTNKFRGYEKGQTIEADVDYLTGTLLPEVMDDFYNKSPFEALQFAFGKICPKSLMNGEVDHLLCMEAFCRDYHVPPLGADVGYLEYPQRIVIVFGIISVARERVKAKEMERIKESTKVKS